MIPLATVLEEENTDFKCSKVLINQKNKIKISPAQEALLLHQAQSSGLTVQTQPLWRCTSTASPQTHIQAKATARVAEGA